MFDLYVITKTESNGTIQFLQGENKRDGSPVWSPILANALVYSKRSAEKIAARLDGAEARSKKEVVSNVL